ncbi:MAG: hypothetical protein ACLUN9_21435 [Enterocloster aldenensis]
MEHIMDRIRAAAEPDRERFLEEWFSGQYDRMQDCLHYEAVLAFCKALNALGRYQYHDYEPVTPGSVIKEEKERRRQREQTVS